MPTEDARADRIADLVQFDDVTGPDERDGLDAALPFPLPLPEEPGHARSRSFVTRPHLTRHDGAVVWRR